MTRLVVGYAGALPIGAGRAVQIDEKLRSGVARYRAGWPGGDVVLAAAHTRASADTGLGTRFVDRDELGFELVTGDTWRESLDASSGDLYLLPLLHRTAEVEHLLDRTVLTVEFTPEDLANTERGAAAGLASRARITAGSAKRRRRFEAWVRRSRGIQCNGYPAYERFAGLSASALLFFDTRLTDDHVRLARGHDRGLPVAPYRLCFSGRLIDAKGPRHAVRVAERLQAMGLDCTLDIIGVGPLEQELRATPVPGVHFREGMDFADGWTSYIRNEVDLMVLPHTQGDPSGTYLESVGCGVPVVGFDNVALASLVRHHRIGHAVPLGDDDALAAAAASVLTDPAHRADLRANGLAFMGHHTFEHEAGRRIEQLVCLSA